MADFDIDDHEIAEFIRALEVLQRSFPRQARTVMRRVGNKARVKVRSLARQLVNQDTGNYVRGITRGKVWVDEGSTYNVRVYPKSKLAPHALLIENGFVHTGHEPGKQRGEFVPGKHVYERATHAFEAEFHVTMEAEFNRVVNKIP